MASVNFQEIKERLKGLTFTQLETLYKMVNQRMQDVHFGAKIEPYNPDWANSPIAPPPKVQGKLKRWPAPGNPQTGEGSGLDDDDIPF